MRENSCRIERRGEGTVLEWTLSLGKDARIRVWDWG